VSRRVGEDLVRDEDLQSAFTLIKCVDAVTNPNPVCVCCVVPRRLVVLHAFPVYAAISFASLITASLSDPPYAAAVPLIASTSILERKQTTASMFIYDAKDPSTHLEALLHHPSSEPPQVASLARAGTVAFFRRDPGELFVDLVRRQRLEVRDVFLDSLACDGNRAGDVVLV